MPRLVSSYIPATVGVTGKLYWLRPLGDSESASVSEFKEMPFPAGTQVVARRPSWAEHSVLGRSRKYGVGGWTANILVDEDFRFLRQGIPAPNVVPALTASGTGITGAAVPYLRFLDSRAGRVGPLSAAGASLTLTNQGRQWGTVGGGLLPTTGPDPSVDMLQGLVSMDGATARVAWTRQLGVTSVTENVATLALGEAAPAVFTEMPLGIYNAVWHDRQAITGNDRDPTSLVLSALGFLERSEGLKFSSDGLPMNGVFPGGGGDTLYAGTREEIWRLTGFTEGDFTWEKDRPDMGLVSHFGVAQVDKKVIVPTTVGVYLNVAGSWIPFFGDRQKEWAREYKLWRDDYEAAFGFYDPERLVYTFGPVRHSKLRNLYGGSAWVEWVLNCENLSAAGDGQAVPAWANDVQHRKKTSKAVFYLPGSSQPEIVSGNEDGILRLENRDEDDDDDGDLYLKRMIVEPPSVMPDVGGAPMDGFTFQKAWTYIKSEVSAWVAEFRAGGRNARKRADPDWSDSTPASAAGNAEPKEGEPHVLEQVGGDALNYGVVIDRAKDVEFNGFGGTYSPGLGGALRRGADARGLGPGQVVDLNDSQPLDACGNPSGSPWVLDTHLIADDTQGYFYSVQRHVVDQPGTLPYNGLIRIMRFAKGVAGEANVLIRNNASESEYYTVGLATSAVSGPIDIHEDGEQLGLLELPGATVSSVVTLGAENGVIYFFVRYFPNNGPPEEKRYYTFDTATGVFTLILSTMNANHGVTPFGMFSLSGTRYVALNTYLMTLPGGVFTIYPVSDEAIQGRIGGSALNVSHAFHPEYQTVVAGAVAYINAFFDPGDNTKGGVIKVAAGPVLTAHRYVSGTVPGIHTAGNVICGYDGVDLLVYGGSNPFATQAVLRFNGTVYSLHGTIPDLLGNVYRYRLADTRMWRSFGSAKVSSRSNAADFTVFNDYDPIAKAGSISFVVLKFIP